MSANKYKANINMVIEEFSINNLFNEQSFSLKITENKLILVSENGSGKTTILRLI